MSIKVSVRRLHWYVKVVFSKMSGASLLYLDICTYNVYQSLVRCSTNFESGKLGSEKVSV